MRVFSGTRTPFGVGQRLTLRPINCYSIIGSASLPHKTPLRAQLARALRRLYDWKAVFHGATGSRIHGRDLSSVLFLLRKPGSPASGEFLPCISDFAGA